jgi:lipopolysaccharide transport system ATP-binding protein
MHFSIRAEGIGKRYRLGLDPSINTLREVLSGLHWGTGTHRSTRELWALQDVSLDISAGEVVGIIGANGAGKSTLLKVLSRITAPTTGRAEIRGRVGSLLEVGTGFHPELTGRENVFLNGAILGMRHDEVKARFDEIVAFAEVEPFLDTPVKRYSSGMALRLAFAVAAHLKTEVLIVDEVLAVGDVAFQRKCLGKFGEVATSGRTVLFVSHNLSAVARLCGRAVWLQGGRVRQIGDARTVVGTYLAASTTARLRCEWHSPEESPGDDALRLDGVEVLDAGASPSSSFHQDLPFLVRIRYRILRSLSDSNVGFELRTGDGISVFASFDSDNPGWGGRSRAPGAYECTCSVPAHFLNEGRYLLTIEGGVPFVRLAFRLEDVLALDVGPPLSTGGPVGRMGARRRGVLAPALQWTIREAGR